MTVVLILFFVVLAMVIPLAFRTRDPLDLLDPISYFLLTHFVFFFVGIAYASRYDEVVPIQTSVCLMIYLGLLGFVSGVVIGDLLTGADAARPRAYSLARLDSSYVLAAWLVFVLGISFLGLYGWRAGFVDWLGAGGFDDYRVQVRKGQGWIAILSIAFVTVGALLLSTYYLFRRDRAVLAWAIATVGAVGLLLLGNRAPAVELLVMQLVFWCVSRWGKLPLALAGSAAAAMLLAVALLGVVRQDAGVSQEMILVKLLWRPFVNIQNFQTVVDAYPSGIDYEYGGTLVKDLRVLLPGYQPNYGTWLKEELGMRFTGGGITVTYLGEAFANLGFYGILLLPVIVGTFMAMLSSVLRKVRHYHAFLPVAAVFAISSKAIVSSGILTPALYTLLPMSIALVFHFVAHELLRTSAREHASVEPVA